MNVLEIPREALEDLVSLLRAIVPGKDAPPGWSQGWQACCSAIETVADHQRTEETS